MRCQKLPKTVTNLFERFKDRKFLMSKTLENRDHISKTNPSSPRDESDHPFKTSPRPCFSIVRRRKGLPQVQHRSTMNCLPWNCRRRRRTRRRESKSSETTECSDASGLAHLGRMRKKQIASASYAEQSRGGEPGTRTTDAVDTMRHSGRNGSRQGAGKKGRTLKAFVSETMVENVQRTPSHASVDRVWRGLACQTTCARPKISQIWHGNRTRRRWHDLRLPALSRHNRQATTACQTSQKF